MTTLRLFLAALAAFLVCGVAIGQPRPGAGTGTGVTDGDKGHITVSGTGATWNIDASGMAAVAANAALTGAFLGITAEAADVDPDGTAIAAALAAKLNATGGTATNTVMLGSRHTIRAIGNASTAQTISWTDYDTITLTLDSASCELTFAEGSNLAAGQDRTICVVATMDGTGNRELTYAGVTLNLTPQLNPRANAVTTLYFTTRNQGTNADVVGPEPLIVTRTIVAPNDAADAVRDALYIWKNKTGRTMYVTGWEAISLTDDTTLNIEEVDADGANNATVDAVEIATNGTGMFYASDTTISAGTIEANHWVVLDFDDTDTPTEAAIVLTLWP